MKYRIYCNLYNNSVKVTPMIRSFLSHIGPCTTIQEFSSMIARVYEGMIRPEGGVLKGGIIITDSSKIRSINWDNEPNSITFVCSSGYACAMVEIDPTSYSHLKNIYLALEGRIPFPDSPGAFNMKPIKVTLPVSC